MRAFNVFGIFIVAVILLLTSACNQKKDSKMNSFIREKPTFTIKGLRIDSIEHSPFYEIFLINSSLLCTTRESSSFFSCYSISTPQYPLSFEFGKTDRSPEEMVFPFIIQNSSKTDSINIWDMVLCSIKEFKWSDLMEKKFNSYKEKSLPLSLRGMYDPSLYHNKLLLTSTENKQGLLAVFDCKTNSMQWINPALSLLDLKPQDTDYSILSSNSYSVNQQSGIIGVGLKHTNIVLFTDTAGILLHEYQIGAKIVKPSINASLSDVSKESEVFCTHSFATDENFFFVYNRLTYKEYLETNPSKGSCIYIFDRNGKYETNVQLDKAILKGALDETSSMLYGIELNSQINAQVIMYDFSFLK